MPDPEDLADLALLTDAALEAGRIAMRHFKSDPQVWEKDAGQGPVTEADLEVNAMLVAQLWGGRPTYGWMSEESEDDPARASARRVFVLDPIDGTRAFIDGTTAFAHSFAVVEQGQVRVGVVYMPAQDKLYRAVLGGGATLNDAPIKASGATDLAQATLLAVKASFAPELWSGPVPEVKRAYRPSLAYRLCLVAQGRFDGMITPRPAWEWDTAAGSLIAQEAGAVVTDAQGAPITFNAPGRQHQGCFVAPAPVHDALIKARLGDTAA